MAVSSCAKSRTGNVNPSGDFCQACIDKAFAGTEMDLKLAGKLALVSGSTAGIGHAIAELLTAEGARVIVNGRTQAGVDEALASIRKVAGKDALGFAGDLSDASVAETLVKKHPGIEILVNNLGIFEAKNFEEIPDADWVRFFEVNVLSGVRLARLVSARHAPRQLGPHHLHLQRERHADPGRNDPLRHDQGGADRRRARNRGNRRRHGHHRQQRLAGTRRDRAASATSSKRWPASKANPRRRSKRISSRRCVPRR